MHSLYCILDAIIFTTEGDKQSADRRNYNTIHDNNNAFFKREGEGGKFLD